jgi:hypothetical protein
MEWGKHGRRNLGRPIKVKITMNFLEKYCGNEKGLTPVSDDRRVMDEALARLRQHEVIEPDATAKAHQALACTPPDIVEVARICAVHDKPYIAIYRRGENGLFICSRTMRLTAEGNPRECAAAENSITLDFSLLDPNGAGESCPWCKAAAKIALGRRLNSVWCGGCRAFVCLGRTEENYFRCRDSCRCAGELAARWVASEGIARRDAAPQASGMEAPETTTLRLTSANQSPAKGGK